MPKRKKASPVLRFHKDFVEPTSEQRKDALGPFPCPSKASSSREAMLRRIVERGQPSLSIVSLDDDVVDIDVPLKAWLNVDDRQLYIPTPRSETSFAVAKPSNELDWLAQVPEEGQTFEDYLTLLTTRTSGRMKAMTNAEGLDILLLPIVRGSDSRNGEISSWPSDGPPLDKLVEYTKLFFDRQVRVLEPAKLWVEEPHTTTTTRATANQNGGSRTKKRSGNGSSTASVAPGATSKCEFKLSFPGFPGPGTPNDRVNVVGRIHPSSKKLQLQVISLLEELSDFRFRRLRSGTSTTTTTNPPDFCIMGVTMEDLFDGPKDLFCGGMAFGGNKVAVFSFFRYHPSIKMHPLHWHDYAYTDTFDGYSYYEDGDREKTKGVLSSEPPSPSSLTVQSRRNTTTVVPSVEFLRRSFKLLTHELGHLYGLDHCVHNRCLMMGAGHLVEDFTAPTHVCGVCLRKLQWRLGFDVTMRYKLLSDFFEGVGMEKERKWTRKQYEHLKRKTQRVEEPRQEEEPTPHH